MYVYPGAIWMVDLFNHIKVCFPTSSDNSDSMIQMDTLRCHMVNGICVGLITLREKQI